MSEESSSADDLRALRVVDLKQKLTEIGLPTSGRKEDLVIRLSDYYSSQSGDQNAVFVEGGSVPDEESQESVEQGTGDDQDEEVRQKQKYKNDLFKNVFSSPVTLDAMYNRVLIIG